MCRVAAFGVSVTVLFLSAISGISQGRILGIVEAEKTTITCDAGTRPFNMKWASAGQMAPASWGRAKGDRLEWDLDVRDAGEKLKLGVRYAYDEPWHKAAVKTPAPRHLLLKVGDSFSTLIDVPNTHTWNHFAISDVDLPLLPVGMYHVTLESPAPLTCTNIDSFIVHTGDEKPYAPGPLRPTEIGASKSGKFVLCVSPQVTFQESPEDILDTFDKLYGIMCKDFARELPGVVTVHLTEPGIWFGGRCDAVKNQFGIYLRADGKPLNRESWCWTLAQCYVEGYLPPWFGVTLNRVAGTLDWLPSVRTAKPSEVDRAAELIAQAQDFLTSESVVASGPEVVHAAVRLKYGEDVFQKLAHRLSEMAQANHNRLFDKFQVMQALNDVTRDDVLPMYKRWPGFATEGPIDPLPISTAATP